MCTGVCMSYHVRRDVQGLEAEGEQDCIKQAAINACELVRTAQGIAYGDRGRSMVASDILHSLHTAVKLCWKDS